MKRKCPLCGLENEEGSKFCKNCNELLSKEDYSENNPYFKKGGIKTNLLNLSQMKK